MIKQWSSFIMNDQDLAFIYLCIDIFYVQHKTDGCFVWFVLNLNSTMIVSGFQIWQAWLGGNCSMCSFCTSNTQALFAATFFLLYCRWLINNVCYLSSVLQCINPSFFTYFYHFNVAVTKATAWPRDGKTNVWDWAQTCTHHRLDKGGITVTSSKRSPSVKMTVGLDFSVTAYNFCQ